MSQMQSGRSSVGKSNYNPLDISFLNQGFYNEQGNIREELLDSQARKLAQRFGPKGGFDKVSSAQVRRFFGDVRELEAVLKKDRVNMKSREPKDIEEHLPVIKMLKSKLAYAMGRNVIPKSFALTLSRAIDQIKSPRDFKAFILFFESVVGYYYGEGGGRIR